MSERNFVDYNSYYQNQIGGNYPLNSGISYQRGSGRIGNLARRYGIPVLRYLLKHGKDIGKEAISGMKTGIRKAAASTLKDIKEKVFQEGQGQRRKPRIIKRHSKKRKVVKTKTASKKKRRKSSKKSKQTSRIIKRFNVFQ